MRNIDNFVNRNKKRDEVCPKIEGFVVNCEDRVNTCWQRTRNLPVSVVEKLFTKTMRNIFASIEKQSLFDTSHYFVLISRSEFEGKLEAEVETGAEI